MSSCYLNYAALAHQAVMQGDYDQETIFLNAADECSDVEMASSCAMSFRDDGGWFHEECEMSLEFVQAIVPIDKLAGEFTEELIASLPMVDTIGTEEDVVDDPEAVDPALTDPVLGVPELFDVALAARPTTPVVNNPSNNGPSGNGGGGGGSNPFLPPTGGQGFFPNGGSDPIIFSDTICCMPFPGEDPSDTTTPELATMPLPFAGVMLVAALAAFGVLKLSAKRGQ